MNKLVCFRIYNFQGRTKLLKISVKFPYRLYAGYEIHSYIHGNKKLGLKYFAAYWRFAIILIVTVKIKKVKKW